MQPLENIRDYGCSVVEHSLRMCKAFGSISGIAEVNKINKCKQT
jgi:hypothetical protein